MNSNFTSVVLIDLKDNIKQSLLFYTILCSFLHSVVSRTYKLVSIVHTRI